MVFWEVFENYEIFVAAFPVLEEDATDGAVESAGEEGEIRPWRVEWRRREEFWGHIATVEVDFWEGHIFLGVEAFGGVGIAEDSD